MLCWIVLEKAPENIRNNYNYIRLLCIHRFNCLPDLMNKDSLFYNINTQCNGLFMQYNRCCEPTGIENWASTRKTSWFVSDGRDGKSFQSNESRSKRMSDSVIGQCSVRIEFSTFRDTEAEIPRRLERIDGWILWCHRKNRMGNLLSGCLSQPQPLNVTIPTISSLTMPWRYL